MKCVKRIFKSYKNMKRIRLNKKGGHVSVGCMIYRYWPYLILFLTMVFSQFSVLCHAQNNPTVRISPGQESNQKKTTALNQKRNEKPKLNLNHPFAGVRRILIELEDQSDSGQFYAGKYLEVVEKAIKSLKKQQVKCPLKSDDSLTSVDKQTAFFMNVWDYLYDSLKVEYSDGESRLWKTFTRDKLLMDCDRVSFMVFDIGKAMKFNIGMFHVKSPFGYHAFVACSYVAFDASESRYCDFFSRSLVNLKNEMVFSYADNPHSMQAITYSELHWYWKQNLRMDKSVQCAVMACKTDSLNAKLWLELGQIYSEVGDYNASYDCFRKLKKVLPLSDRYNKFKGMVTAEMKYTNSLKIAGILKRD